MKVTVIKGKTLYDALEKEQIVLDRPCGGRGTCGQCMVEVERFGKVKACQFRIPGNYEVTVPKSFRYTAIAMEVIGDKLWQGFEQTQGVFVAVDIGTTTVVIAAYARGRQSQCSFVNSQRAYGADVMSRIRFSMEGKGDKLQKVLMEQLMSGIEQTVGEVSPQAESCQVVISANTTMIHLLCGWDCSGLGAAPFHPVSLNTGHFRWKGQISCNVTILPGISAFVGADIASGIHATQLMKQSSLLIDLGTNGEMVLWTGKKLLCASAAAGPAFEGSEAAMYIHAAGILHCLAKLRREKIIDKYGTLCEKYFENGYPIRLSDYTKEKQGTVFLTQEHIRDIQMAKAAIRAGIQILIEKSDIQEQEIKKVFLAGGMGYYIDPKDAAAIGLLPESFVPIAEAAGNSSLAGAVCYLRQIYVDGCREEQIQKEWEEICRQCEEVVFPEQPDFMDIYVGHMNFTSTSSLK